MRHLFVIFSIFLNLNTLPGFTQNKLAEADNLTLSALQDSLVVLADSMLRAPIPDERLDFGFDFAKTLQNALSIEGSYLFPFSKLGEIIPVLTPEDQSFRVFNWLVAPSENIRRYYAIIQMADGTLYPLLNHADQYEGNLSFAVLDRRHWLGCEYYRIKTVSSGKTKYYCLFGLNRDGSYSNKKILDVLTFTEDGPVFGAPLFAVPNENETRLQTQHRVIWEYDKTALFSLNFDEDRNMIMFDRLHSRINNPKRKDTYIPTGQTDGLRWDKGQWMFVREAIPILKLKEGEAPIDGVLPGSRR